MRFGTSGDLKIKKKVVVVVVNISSQNSIPKKQLSLLIIDDVLIRKLYGLNSYNKAKTMNVKNIYQ